MSVLADRQRMIVVDVEAAGMAPPTYPLLSIGACTLAEPRERFYVELKPDGEAFTEESLAVCGLSMAALAKHGTPPMEAMRTFADWALAVVPQGTRPLFAAFNAPFDWLYCATYFERYLGRNPFGYKALDIKALYMGVKGVSWAETSHLKAAKHYGLATELSHNALEDALAGAELLDNILVDLEKKELTHDPGT
jgi:DNA polymerase III epsilon subunit-like protein